MQTSVDGDGESGSNPGNDAVVEPNVLDNDSSLEPARVSPSDPSASSSPNIADESPNLNLPRVSEGQNVEITPAPAHDREKLVIATEDYDSILSDFDAFASKGDREAVGYGYSVGDMVWGKVKSHPWWPGHIYNEAFASASVRRIKSEGHVLVAFFGDGSYGWFDPGELIPFEENFVEKSRQTNSKGFLNAVEEAVDELMRRRGLGVACKCRNLYNFSPTTVQGYYSVTVGDYEPGIFSTSQISKARESFQPKAVLSFVQQMAVRPMSGNNLDLEFVKKKATVLACRKATFEEFDDTYAQAFGSNPVRLPRPTEPVAVDPAKAPLSGRLVIAEPLGKGKSSLKPAKTKVQAEKDKYIFKRRDEPGVSGRLVDSNVKDFVFQTPVPGNLDIQQQTTVGKLPKVIDAKDIRKPVEGGKKKFKVQKRPPGVLSAEDPSIVEKKIKKRKKEVIIDQPGGDLSVMGPSIVEKKKKKKISRIETSSEANANLAQLPGAVSSSRVVAEQVPGNAEFAPTIKIDNPVDEVKIDTSSTAEAKLVPESITGHLPLLLSNLRALALDPFYESDMGGPNATHRVFLKYRSLVYQKSLSSQPLNNEAGEGRSNKAPAPAEKSHDKSVPRPVRPSIDPTKGGKKRGPSDHPDVVKKKKKLNQSQELLPKKKPLGKSEETMKKKLHLPSEDPNKAKRIADPLKASEKKIPQKSNEAQRSDLKERNVLQKATKPEPSKKIAPPRTAPKPTMLVMKFPAGASLPSSAELRVKFARFGPLDHSATRVFWKTFTCRLVYKYKADAEAACEFAISSGNLFGSTNVRCYTRDPSNNAADMSELFKVQNEEAAPSTIISKEAIVEPRTTAKPSQPTVQLKSILKKPSSDEGGNGNGRGTRVKFSSVGEGSSKSEMQQQFSNVPTSHSMDVINSKNVPSELKAARSASKFAVSQDRHLRSSLGEKDFSQQFLNLLTKCSDVVNTLTGALGYVPYHPL